MTWDGRIENSKSKTAMSRYRIASYGVVSNRSLVSSEIILLYLFSYCSNARPLLGSALRFDWATSRIGVARKLRSAFFSRPTRGAACMEQGAAIRA
jgi:hypothetical protein